MAYVSTYAPEAPSREAIEAMSGEVLLEFGAPGCPYCQQVQPILRELLAVRPAVQHLKVEDGKGKRLGRSFGVKLWPNFVFLRDGKSLRQLARPNEKELESVFAELLQKTEISGA